MAYTAYGEDDSAERAGYGLCRALVQNCSSFINTGSSESEEMLRTSECICPGYTSVFQCTVVGSGSTVWRGGIFSCLGNEVSLRHSQFQSGAAGECNNGAIVAESLSVVDNCYTSRLTVAVQMEMDGQTLECAHDDGLTVTTIGMTRIDIETGKYIYR